MCSLKLLLSDLVTRIQQARYEDFILNLASAYEGYKLDLPAFMDFRGRIYRAGILHFHERDLAKSLIRFAHEESIPVHINVVNDDEGKKRRTHLAYAAAFKFKKFSTLKESYIWYMDMLKEVGPWIEYQSQSELEKSKSNIKLINLALRASDPFQFLAKFQTCDRVDDYQRAYGFNKVPVSQDASASAYQIMSYLLLNDELGMQIGRASCRERV